jgi:hypothetical protein
MEGLAISPNHCSPRCQGVRTSRLLWTLTQHIKKHGVVRGEGGSNKNYNNKKRNMVFKNNTLSYWQKDFAGTIWNCHDESPSRIPFNSPLIGGSSKFPP